MVRGQLKAGHYTSQSEYIVKTKMHITFIVAGCLFEVPDGHGRQGCPELSLMGLLLPSTFLRLVPRLLRKNPGCREESPGSFGRGAQGNFSMKAEIDIWTCQAASAKKMLQRFEEQRAAAIEKKRQEKQEKKERKRIEKERQEKQERNERIEAKKKNDGKQKGDTEEAVDG